MASSNSTSSFTAVNDNDNFSQLDLNGKIIIKAQYNEDIRRIPIIGDEITFDELVLMMQRLFKLQPTDEIQLKYRDDDNDLISIIDDNDLSFAIQYSRILKLRVFVNEPPSGERLPGNYREICHELINIRNRCNLLLEKLHLTSDKSGGSKSGTGAGANSDDSVTNEVHTQTEHGAGDGKTVNKTYGQPPKELDPLSEVSTGSFSAKETSSLSSGDIKQHSPGQPQQQSHDQQGDNKPPFSQIAQQPVLQQAFPAPPVRPPMPNQPSFSQPGPFQPPPPPMYPPPSSRSFSSAEPPKPPQMQPPQQMQQQVPPPPPTSSTASFGSDNTGYRQQPGPMPPGFNTGPPPTGSMPPYMPYGSAPPSQTPQGGPPQPPPGGMMSPPQQQQHHGPPPPGSDGSMQQQHHHQQPGPLSPPGGMGPPMPLPGMMGMQQMPPSSMAGGPPPPPPQMPPSSMAGGQYASQQQQPAPRMPGGPQGGPVPPPPMMPQFNQQQQRAMFSYQNLRNRYPTAGM